MDEVEEYPILTRDEEAEFGREGILGRKAIESSNDENEKQKLRKRDSQIAEMFIKSGLGFVKSQIIKIFGRINPDLFEELVEVGRISLLKGYRGYNPDYNGGSRYLSYAGKGVKRDLRSAIERIRRNKMVSLETEVGDGESSFGDFLYKADDGRVRVGIKIDPLPVEDNTLNGEKIREYIGQLSPAEQKLVYGCYYDGKTMREIADEIGINSATTISNRLAGIRRKLSHMIFKEHPTEVLDLVRGSKKAK